MLFKSNVFMVGIGKLAIRPGGNQTRETPPGDWVRRPDNLFIATMWMTEDQRNGWHITAGNLSGLATKLQNI